jgi:hypothetical protein
LRSRRGLLQPSATGSLLASADELTALKATRRGDPRDAFWVSTLQNDKNNQTYAFAALKGELWPTSFEWRNAKEGALHVSLRSGSPEGLEKILMKPGRLVEVDPVLVLNCIS